MISTRLDRASVDPFSQAPELRGHRRIARDTAFIVGAQVIGLAVTLLATPYQLSRMGYERYGLLSLSVAAVSVFNFLDLGLSWSALRYLPILRGHRGSSVADDAASLLVSCALGIGLAVAAVTIAVAGILTAAAGGTLGLGGERLAIVVLCAALLPALMTSNVLSSVARAVGQFRAAAIISAAYFVGTNIVWVAAAGRRWDVEVVLAAQVIFCVFSGLIWLRRVRHAGLARVYVKPPMGFLSEHGRPLLTFALFAAFGGLATNLLLTADKLAFAMGIGVALLPLYTISVALCGRLAIVAVSLTAVVFPRLSSAHAAEDKSQYALLSQWAIRATALCTAVVGAVVFWAGNDFVSMWISPGFAQKTSVTVKLLTVGFAVWSIGQLGYAANDARGRVRRSMISGFCCATLGLIGAGVVSGRYGVAAGAAVFAAALTVNGVVGLLFGYGPITSAAAAVALRFCLPAFAAVGVCEWLVMRLNQSPLLGVTVAVVASLVVLAAQARSIMPTPAAAPT